jgi:hypothetical protein
MDEPQDEPLNDPTDPDNLLEMAWGIIANANEGNWGSATDEWREAAERWRDQYHAHLDVVTSGIDLDGPFVLHPGDVPVFTIKDPMYPKHLEAIARLVEARLGVIPVVVAGGELAAVLRKPQMVVNQHIVGVDRERERGPDLGPAISVDGEEVGRFEGWPDGEGPLASPTEP